MRVKTPLQMTRESGMSVLASDSPASAQTASALQSLQALLRFLSAVSELKSLDRVAFSTDGVPIDIWVVLKEDVAEDAETVYAAEEAYTQTPGVLPIDVHVIALSRVDERNLPAGRTVLTVFGRE